ncbi:MAG: LPS export ABC transporter periplasmic protein LptC [Gemmatimonadales bacterium]|nr:LPS export ABC transporter periplasmic protein LptC [Gemmatimonadales bacterium]MDZ4391121.1 LPS export ABC transporter periplasmic protein LptC [Gemmatimonadales bacterium]
MIRLLVILLVLAACSPRGVAPMRTTLADSSDQVIDSMRTVITRNGVKTTELEADTAWIYQSRQVADLKGVRIVFYEPNGAVSSTVTADTGMYQMRDGTLDARGNVVATTPNGRVVKTEHLIFDRIANQIRSDTAYTFTSPTEEGSGMGFTTDPDFRRFQTTGARGRQRGPGVILPDKSEGAP